MALGDVGSPLVAELNRLANGGTYPLRTAFLEEAGAANAWAGTTGLETVGALNAKHGITDPKLFLELDGICNALAGTTGLAAPAALRTIAS